MPTLRTRQALLILDLQNDFVSPGGALTVQDGDGLVSRVVEVAKAFRESGAGDVVWIRSQFDGHRSLDEGNQIVTTDAPFVPKRHTSSRGRQLAPGRHEQEVKEADEEAFLSVPPDSQKPECVRPGAHGSQLVDEAQRAVDSNKDIVFTKTHYSAFAAGQQLLQLLRGRFVTEIYVCGALTNVSIYATALDAASHGYAITLIDDCCGYRSDMRHSNAIHQLMHLTGCEVTTAEEIMAEWKPKQKKNDGRSIDRRIDSTEVPSGGSRRLNRENKRTSGMKEEKGGVNPDTTTPEDDISGVVQSSLKMLTLASGTTANRSVPSEDSPQPHLETRQTHTRAAPVDVPHEGTGAKSLSQYLKKSPTNAVRASASATQPDQISLSVRSADRSPTADAAKLRDSQTPPSLTLDENNQPTASTMLQGTRAVDASSSEIDEGKASDMTLFEVDNNTLESSPLEGCDSQSPSTSPLEVDSTSKPTSEPPIYHNAPSSSSQPIVSSPLCEGDTTLITNLLSTPLSITAFDNLKSEVRWNRMSHQGGEVPRLVAVQGNVDSEGNYPIYRHPSDESPPLLPFSPTVSLIKSYVEKAIGHELNHVLIQLYRSGQDYISEHSDKTLDIAHGSYICNVSLGAERTMVFRTKRVDKDPSRRHTDTSSSLSNPPSTTEVPGPKRETVRTPLPHNSLIRMGLATNSRWLHAIRQDKRLTNQKSPTELAYSGERISLTFRKIATFTDASQSLIWGQGATSKTRDSAQPVINGQTPEAVRMLQAFGTENHSSDFDWEGVYGGGFDVVNLGEAKRLFLSQDAVVNMRILMMLGDLEIGVAKGATGTEGMGNEAGIKFVDNGEGRTEVEGQLGIMLYLDAVYGRKPGERAVLGRKYSRFQSAIDLLDRWRAVPLDEDGTGPKIKQLKKELGVWEGWLAESEKEKGEGKQVYMAGGDRASIVDYALWPVLHQIMKCKSEAMGEFPGLRGYYDALRGSTGAKRALGERDS
ncbi:hypothetical protein DL546_008905 [Coniochaeta pulveracea]|uniref:Fe2OG dioxygenase domain-containing protein n=1 Tax=Coniochaeta pulveracea TaxID=177199 RepID=A0A420YG19_9PEZI|nr:hypothetical protein DL546_008905 [Coniochaeta pulveracea]